MKRFVVHTSGICISIVFCVLSFQRTWAQNIKADMKRLNSKFEKAVSIQYDIKVSSYATLESTPQVDVFHYEQNSKQYYFKTPSFELFVDKQLSLIVYKESKVMLWSKSNSDEFSYKKNLPGINPDSILVGTDSVKFLGNSDGLNTYAIYSSKNYIMRIEINIDPKTDQIVDLIYYYDTNKKMGYYKTITHFDRLILSDEVVSISKNRADFITGEIPNIKKASTYSGYNLQYVDNE